MNYPNTTDWEKRSMPDGTDVGEWLEAQRTGEYPVVLLIPHDGRKFPDNPPDEPHRIPCRDVEELNDFIEMWKRR